MITKNHCYEKYLRKNMEIRNFNRKAYPITMNTVYPVVNCIENSMYCIQGWQKGSVWTIIKINFHISTHLIISVLKLKVRDLNKKNSKTTSKDRRNKFIYLATIL